jgi:YD repeat-containing protein
MNRKALQAPVTIEYDSRGRRVTKTLPDSYTARRYYAGKDQVGKRPAVVHKQAS